MIANEPNQPRFWQPQFRNGKPVAGHDYERVLALCYDALKKVDPTIKVVGGALSGRGNDNAKALTNRSTSPLRFLYDLGAAYRTSKRKAPLMDLFAFHPYPRSSLDSLKKGLEWPMAGYANLDRVKQGLWDAFDGTRQQTTENGLGIMIDEIGLAGSGRVQRASTVRTPASRTSRSRRRRTRRPSTASSSARPSATVR